MSMPVVDFVSSQTIGVQVCAGREEPNLSKVVDLVVWRIHFLSAFHIPVLDLSSSTVLLWCGSSGLRLGVWTP
ncbi:unnamed protein product [Arabis nemorensis]|uniref:Uncharacterized protein n=1 Tax=Arabis nemorensis TaxID=586526 RepID=A0A565CPC6_9BRAS|nr:unnamed protein product [Arabis nemorensis]